MLPRLIFLALAVTAVYFTLKWLLQSRDGTVKCSRCGGKGFWYDARGKEKCDWCKGSGRLPKDFGQ